MNIATMHIGIELMLQELNSNFYNKLQHEEKDYIINRVIENFVRAVATDERNEIHNIVSYEDIKKYYTIINPFIRDVLASFINYESEGYVECIIPRANEVGLLTSDNMLYDGVTYKVQTAGDTDLASFGYVDGGNQEVGDEFICNILEISSFASLQLTKGEIYRIVNNPEDYSFTQYGAESDEVGSQFKVKEDVLIEDGSINAVLKPIARFPVWGKTPETELIAFDNLEKFEFISSESFVECGNPITSGALVKDEYYAVLVNGTTDLRGYGAYGAGFNSVGLVFKCIANGTPTWLGLTRLIKVSKVPNRLIKYQDKATFLSHAYGTLQTSPVSTMIDNKLRVYHSKKFAIHGVFVQYVKTPNTVDYNKSIDCNLPPAIHGKIVDWSAMKIAGTINSPAYPALKDVEITDKSTPK